ncbi:MAG: hypothetical protein HND44_08315 [Chloroflexi bacterium]|nr:hypothetical protein [Ardenticatenaceae bacterium]MBL1128486.1 hypothetical protein [Chloroflexota bacterium]NOG34563.1 hypothetical protein [Chloroflexota bacterium]
MNDEKELAHWAEWVQEMAASFPYPPTPDSRGGVRQPMGSRPSVHFARSPRLAWVVILVALVLALLAVPQVRAAMLRLFQIGAITVFEVDEPPLPSAEIWATKPARLPLVAQGLAVEVSLAEARTAVPTGLFLPTYPADLGKPDVVYLAETGWPQTIISVWNEPTDLALYQIGAEQFAYKGAPVIEETAVNGQWAIWLAGPHRFMLADGRWQEWQFIESNVLIWWARDGLTFRLEGAESLAAAIRIAESLHKYEDGG